MITFHPLSHRGKANCRKLLQIPLSPSPSSFAQPRPSSPCPRDSSPPTLDWLFSQGRKEGPCIGFYHIQLPGKHSCRPRSEADEGRALAKIFTLCPKGYLTHRPQTLMSLGKPHLYLFILFRCALKAVGSLLSIGPRKTFLCLPFKVLAPP